MDARPPRRAPSPRRRRSSCRRRARRRRARPRSRGSGRRAPRRRPPPSPRARRRRRNRRASRGRRARTRAGRAPGSRRARRSRPPRRPVAAIPQSGQRTPSSAGEPAEALAVLGEVDRVERRAEDPVAGALDRAGELERRLAAELDADADRLLALEHGEHGLLVERLEVEPVGGVVVGRDGLRVAVDHHRLVALRAEALRGVDAAVVELDPLPDPVRAAAEDHDRAARARAARSSRSPRVE